jgi:hypothetical protein
MSMIRGLRLTAEPALAHVTLESEALLFKLVPLLAAVCTPGPPTGRPPPPPGCQLAGGLGVAGRRAAAHTAGAVGPHHD